VKLSMPKHVFDLSQPKLPIHEGGTNDGRSISIVQTLPNYFDSQRPLSLSRQSSQGNDKSTFSNCAKKCCSKCSSRYGNNAVTTVNVPTTLAEEIVRDTFIEISVLVRK